MRSDNGPQLTPSKYEDNIKHYYHPGDEGFLPPDKFYMKITDKREFRENRIT